MKLFEVKIQFTQDELDLIYTAVEAIDIEYFGGGSADDEVNARAQKIRDGLLKKLEIEDQARYLLKVLRRAYKLNLSKDGLFDSKVLHLMYEKYLDEACRIASIEWWGR